MLKTLLIRFAWVVFEKEKLKSSRSVITFGEKNLGVIFYAAVLSTTHSTH